MIVAALLVATVNFAPVTGIADVDVVLTVPCINVINGFVSFWKIIDPSVPSPSTFRIIFPEVAEDPPAPPLIVTLPPLFEAPPPAVALIVTFPPVPVAPAAPADNVKAP